MEATLSVDDVRGPAQMEGAAALRDASNATERTKDKT